VKSNVPAEVGTPKRVPDESNVIPAGKAPEMTDHLYGGTPPAARSCVEYKTPLAAGGIEIVAISSAEDDPGCPARVTYPAQLERPMTATMAAAVTSIVRSSRRFGCLPRFRAFRLRTLRFRTCGYDFTAPTILEPHRALIYWTGERRKDRDLRLFTTSVTDLSITCKKDV